MRWRHKSSLLLLRFCMHRQLALTHRHTCSVCVCVCVCFDKRTLGGPRQTTNGLLRHFVLSSSARLRLGRLLLLFLHRQQVSTSTGVCHGNGFSIRPACCFKLKIYTHTHTGSARNIFHVCSFRWPKNLIYVAQHCSLDLGLDWGCLCSYVFLLDLFSCPAWTWSW